MAYVFYLIYPILITSLGFYFWNVNTVVKHHLRENIKFILISGLLLLIVGNILLIFFFKNETYLYYWDYAAFWKRSLILNQWIDTNPSIVFSELIKSMNYDEYTLFPVLFLIIPFHILGTSFLAYILSIFNAFIIPLVLLSEVAFLILFEWLKVKLTLKHLLFVFIMSAFFIGWYFTLLSGYLGVIGQLFILVILIILMTRNVEDWNTFELILINTLNFSLTFTRRWYIIWVFSFYLSYFVVYVCPSLLHRDYKKFLSDLVKFTLSGIGLAISVVIFFQPYFLNLIGNQYASQYQAYKDSGSFVFFIKLFQFYGFFFLIPVMFILYYASFKSKNNPFRKLALSLFLLSSLNIVLFSTIQGLDWHHFNLLHSQILILSFMGIITLSQNTRKLLWIYSALMIINFTLVFTTVSPSYRDLTHIPFSSIQRTPKSRSDVNEIRDFALYLNDLTQNNRYAYVAASSELLNDDLLRNSQLPWVINTIPNLDATSNIDLRDGFPKDFFNIDYVVVTNPTQYNQYSTSNQYMITLLNETLLNVEEIRNNYQVINSIKLDGVDVFVYEKISNYTQDEVNYFKDKVNEKYPDKPELFKVNY